MLQGESLLGDVDDVLCMTVRSTGQPFVGQVLGRVVPFMSNPLTMTTLPTTFNGPTPPRPVTHYWVLPPHQPDTYSTVRSDTAEIIYWVTLDDKNNNGVRDTGEFYKLHRRVMPILPNLVFHPNYNTLTRSQFLNICDISTRIGTVAGVNTYVSNTLAELGDREHRYGHAELVAGNTFPFRLIPPGAPNRFYPNPHPQFTSLPAVTLSAG